MQTIQNVLESCPHQVDTCHQTKALGIDLALLAGIPFTKLGGKRVRSRKGLVRFKLGNDWRLIYQITSSGYAAISLVSRQRFERELKRRWVAKTCHHQSQEKLL